ncbi:hypothetical protein EG328_000649, partial [Venturia inaequalis]
MCKHRVLIYAYCECAPIFTDTYSTCPLAHATDEICQAARSANTLTDVANIQVRHLCASCEKHSAGQEGQEGQEHKDRANHEAEAEEGTFSTSANDCLRRYSLEHRQAVVARSTNSKRAKAMRDALLLVEEEAEAKTWTFTG